MIAFAFAVAVLLSDDSAVTAPASPQAETTVSAAAPAAPVAKDPKDRIICRKEPVPGSNRPQKICLTAREWTDGAAETGKTSKR